MVPPGGLGIERQPELFVPVEVEPGPREGVVADAGVLAVPGEIRRVGRASQGVRTMRVEEGANVVALAPVITQMDEDDDELL